MKLRPSLLIAIALVAYVVVASVWTGRQNEEGVRVRLGSPVGTVSGGLHVTLPYPIERIVRVPTTEVRSVRIGVLIEDESEAGYLEDLDEDVHWLTGDTNIVELRADVLYTITDPIAYLYGFDAGEDEHEAVIRATSETVLTRLLASSTIESTLATGKIELSRRGMQESQVLLDDLNTGVRLSALNIVEVNPPERVMGAFNDVSSAKADRERQLAEAKGLSSSVLPRARARAGEVVQAAHSYANQLTSRATGEAESFEKLATEVAASPQASRERLWLEAMERILAKTDERIVPPGSRVYVGR